MSLTFNVAVSKISNYPIQICSTPHLKDLSYKGDMHKDSIWHVYYTTRLFNNMSSHEFINSYRSLQAHVINATKMGFGHILLHGPSTFNEFEYAIEPLKLLCKYYKDLIIIEIPCFTNDVHTRLRGSISPLEYMMMYIQSILDIGFTLDNICIDTAHLWSDGLSLNDMILLYKKYPSKYVHLNGNIRAQFKSDVHTFWWSKDNLITRDNSGDDLINLFIHNNSFCVIECTNQDLLWNSILDIKSFADKYNFKLLSQD